MKGNDGRGARRVLLKRVGTVLSAFIMFITTLHMFGIGNRHQRPTPEGNDVVKKLRKSPSAIVPGGKPPIPKMVSFEDKHDLALILSASIHLVDISHNPGELMNTSTDSYDGVYAEFCKLKFEVHKTDPSSVPMFRDLVAASPDCAKYRWKANLKEIAKLAREHDLAIQKSGGSVPKSIPLTAAVFHESRCGSTLVANTLIAMDPEHHRVYSESAPPIKAINMCGRDYSQCSLEQASSVLKDVVYLMGRTDVDQERRLFFKIQSAGTLGLDVFQKAFPETHWLFVYREPVQVMMSHLSQGKHANCVKTMKRPPTNIKKLVRQHGYKDTTELNREEYCAAHLAAICENALAEMTRSGKGIPVNYDDLPDILYTDILPKKLGVPVGTEEIGRIQEIASVYSKGRDDRAGEWHEDSEKKEHQASYQVKKAAKALLQSSYDRLQSV